MSELFPGVIGHKIVMEVLARMKANNTLPHALIFVGPEHVGKTTVAIKLIQSLLETNRVLEAVPDVSIVRCLIDSKTEKTKSAISVEQIRRLREKLSLTPMIGNCKVGFIEEADKLSINAANALLKTLEEPKGNTFLILRTASLESLPKTIVSRSQVFRFYPVAKDLIKDALVKRGLVKEEAMHIAAQSFGRPGLALSYITNGEVRAQRDVLVSSTISILEASVPKQFGMINDIIPKQEQNKAEHLKNILDQWEVVLRDVLLQKNKCENLCVHKADVGIQNLANKLSLSKTIKTLERIQETRQALKNHINAHLALEHIILAIH